MENPKSNDRLTMLILWIVSIGAAAAIVAAVFSYLVWRGHTWILAPLPTSQANDTKPTPTAEAAPFATPIALEYRTPAPTEPDPMQTK